MADHWEFVAAAYGLAVVVLGAYWRRLVRRQRDVERARSRHPSRSGRLQPTAGQPIPGQPIHRQPVSRPPIQ
jgi:hypothetical protein